MLIDCNVHIGRWPFRRLPVEDAEALLRTMDLEGIDHALVAPLESVFLRDGQQGNEALHRMVVEHGDRVTPVACLRPEAPGARDDLRRCRHDWGFGGLKLHPGYHGCSLSSAATGALVEEAVTLGMFLSLSIRMEDERFHTTVGAVPDVPIAEVKTFLETWREARVLLTNVNRGEYPELAQSQAFSAGVVFVEHSELDGPYDPVRDLVDCVTAEHAVFGSHTALRVTHRAVADFNAARLNDSERQMMAETNARRLLGQR